MNEHRVNGMGTLVKNVEWWNGDAGKKVSYVGKGK